jgi:hypothetical protein
MPIGSTLPDDDIVSLLQRCSPHDTDEVIKIMNAAAEVILRQRVQLANYQSLQASLMRLADRFEANLERALVGGVVPCDGIKHDRRTVGHVSGWKEQMETCVCGQKWPCPEIEK